MHMVGVMVCSQSRSQQPQTALTTLQGCSRSCRRPRRWRDPMRATLFQRLWYCSSKIGTATISCFACATTWPHCTWRYRCSSRLPNYRPRTRPSAHRSGVRRASSTSTEQSSHHAGSPLLLWQLTTDSLTCGGTSPKPLWPTASTTEPSWVLGVARHMVCFSHLYSSSTRWVSLVPIQSKCFNGATTSITTAARLSRHSAAAAPSEFRD
mmetsp:Transcript_38047/g.87717  ORF Transcript_38047/g.87717 Transcript_38047/m.87717 type:complete len:209 (-) Transcript_38047:94-720(-)